MTRPEDPWLLLFRNKPTELMTHPPLASSLQSLESCLFLISLMRYPHALTACASAIEGALKARPGYVEQRKTFQQLLSQVRQNSAELALFTQAQLDDFRNLRNRIVHLGFH